MGTRSNIIVRRADGKYVRVRGETGTEAEIFNTLKEAWPGDDSGAEFVYVWDGRSWAVGDPDDFDAGVKDLAAVVAGEEPEPKTAVKAFGGNFVIGHR